MTAADDNAAAWDSLPAETRERVAAFLARGDFTLTSDGSAEAAEDWRRADRVLRQAEDYEPLGPGTAG